MMTIGSKKGWKPTRLLEFLSLRTLLDSGGMWPTPSCAENTASPIQTFKKHANIEDVEERLFTLPIPYLAVQVLEKCSRWGLKSNEEKFLGIC